MGGSALSKRKSKNASVWLQLLLVAAFVGTIAIASSTHGYPPEVLYLIAGMSLLALICYGKDKLAARTNSWRISENSLHLISLIGGWPGAILGQRLFNHKTSKQSFRALFWLTVIINCGLVAWTFTASGKQFLYQGLSELKRYLQPVVGHAILKSNDFVVSDWEAGNS
ncbi:MULTISPECIES: DUF1294 domain-containing protein [unclassified Microbulbifer]|uniref:DUF1294 domain-containing protein n=1 Tax=unclassified Microbulbifer TaxID=2619833 RepID=UPI0027E3FE07|nr:MULTISPECIES: DUF1294 domain-containing protein [unclassified Microbulbifer]